jgi:hypothetical protein
VAHVLYVAIVEASTFLKILLKFAVRTVIRSHEIEFYGGLLKHVLELLWGWIYQFGHIVVNRSSIANGVHIKDVRVDGGTGSPGVEDMQCKSIAAIFRYLHAIKVRIIVERLLAREVPDWYL